MEETSSINGKVGEVDWLTRCLKEHEGASCLRLLEDPAGVLADKRLWPDHLCLNVLQTSLAVWAERRASHAFHAGETAWLVWRDVFPLPVGNEALKRWHQQRVFSHKILPPNDFATLLPSNVLDYGIRAQDQFVPLSDEHIDKLACLMPFKGYEEAVLTLQIQSQNATLDLFGLFAVRRQGWAIILGRLAFVLSGQDISLMDTLNNAKRWWDTLVGQPLPVGRPAGSGMWGSREELESEIKVSVQELREKGSKVTQEKVSDLLHCDVRTLSRRIKSFELNWSELKRFK